MTRVVVAGTFGPIHDGHRALFEAALRAGDEGVVVGLSSDAFANSTRERDVPDYDSRKRRLLDELRSLDDWNRDIDVLPIDDEFDIVEDDPSIDAIVVSPETADVVSRINERRSKHGLSPVESIELPLVTDSADERISSTRIVRGEIDQHGNNQH